jgi:hypothetical protein
MKKLVNVLFIVIVLSGCEKTVELNYKGNQSAIVIEGNITDQPGPYFVKITRSVRLTETGSYPSIDDAVVTISDNAGNTETLTDEGNGIYRTTTMSGIEGRTYTLNVVAEGRTYTAQSTMPARVPFDSIKVDMVSFAGELEPNLIPVYLGPVAKGNNYRFVLSVNNKLVNQHIVQNDEVKNGVVNTVRIELNDDDLELKAGDRISLEMQCIDKQVSLYYTTLALMGDSGPGGGTTPNNPKNNISNGALGIFSAHTTERRNTTIPE